MIVTLEMDPQSKQTIAKLGELGRSVPTAIANGLKLGGEIAKGNIVRDYLSGQSLKRRSGLLSKEINHWLHSDNDLVIGVADNSPAGKYAWLLGPETKTIRPIKGKFLAIPIGEGLTPSGVPRYSSPRDVDKGFFLRTDNKLLFGYKNGKKGKFRALFAMVKSVTITGSDALAKGVLASVDNITDAINVKLDEALKQ